MYFYYTKYKIKKLNMKYYTIQLFSTTPPESIKELKKTLRYFMVEDAKLSLYYFTLDNTICIYTLDDVNWDVDRLSIIVRGTLKGGDFLLSKVNEYDGLMSKKFWDKKKEAKLYFDDKQKYLDKYMRNMKLTKIVEDIQEYDDENDDKVA